MGLKKTLLFTCNNASCIGALDFTYDGDWIVTFLEHGELVLHID